MNTIQRLIGALAVCVVCSAVHADENHGDESKASPREPFQFTARVDWSAPGRSVSESFQVPNDKRLVIENVSASVELPSEQQIIGTFVVTVAGDERTHHFVHVPKTGTFDPDVDNFSPGGGQEIPNNSLDIYSGGQQVRLYADPGTTVDIGVVRNDPSCRFPCGTAIVAVSGYLLDAKSALLTP